MKKKLIVICEVSINYQEKCLNRPVVDLILDNYLRHFDEIHYIGPSDKEFIRLKGKNPKIFYSSVLYGKSIKERIRYFIKFRYNGNRIKKIIEKDENTIMQIRLPGLFPILLYPHIKKVNIPLTSYISIDWPSSFIANYKFPGNKIIALIGDKVQRKIINSSIPVATGNEIASKYSHVVKCYPYFSTSHNEIYRKNINYPPTKLLYVGSLEPRKRVEDIIEAIEILSRIHNDYSLTIVGSGIMYEYLLKLVEDKKLKDRVKFVGQINDKERLKNIYLEHDILVLPSLSEGTPKVLAEAMAHGLVPIATKNVGSNNYIIGDYKNGFLINRLDPKDISDKCIIIRNDKKLFYNIIENGYKYASRHTLNKEVDGMWNYINRKIMNI